MSELVQATVTSHPLRLTLLAVLRDHPASPSQLAREVGQPVGHVAYHVKVMADAGAIELVETRPTRGAVAHVYAARSEICPHCGGAGIRPVDSP